MNCLSIAIECLEPLVPLIWLLLLELRVGLRYVLPARFTWSKERWQEIFDCFFVRFSEGLRESLEEVLSFFFKLSSFFLYDSLGLKFLLHFWLIGTFYKYAFPADTLCISVDAFTMHEVIVPGAFVGGTVGVLHLALTLLLSLLPLTCVISTWSVPVLSVSLHDILFPVSLVILSAQFSVGTVASNRRIANLPMPVLDLVPMAELPIAHIYRSIYILEPSKPWLRYFLDRFLVMSLSWCSLLCGCGSCNGCSFLHSFIYFKIINYKNNSMYGRNYIENDKGLEAYRKR